MGPGRNLHTVVANTVNIHPESDTSGSPMISPVPNSADQNAHAPKTGSVDSIASSSGSSNHEVTHKRQVRLLKNRYEVLFYVRNLRIIVLLTRANEPSKCEVYSGSF